MAAGAVIVHQIPGRVRMRVPARRGDDAYFSRLAAQCSKLDMVSRIKANPETGSMVIEFRDSLEHLVERLRQFDLDISSMPAKRQSISSAPMRDMQPFNLVSGRDINPMFMVGSALTIVGIVQTLRGRILAPSLTVFWYAMEAYRQSRKT